MSSVQLVPNDQLGKAYSSVDIRSIELNRVRERLDREHPELKQRGIELCTRMQLAQLELEAITVELRRVCGDLAGDALAMLQREAQGRVTQGLEQERLKTETASIKRAIETPKKNRA